MIKLGLKLWSVNQDLFHSAVKLYNEKRFDFIELYVVPGSFEKKNFEILRQIPIIIHCSHFMHNFNLMRDDENNLKIFNEVKRFADFFESENIVAHPGIGMDFLILQKNLKKIHDERIIIENMPYKALDRGICYGYSLGHLQKIKELDYKFCLDFSHAVKAARSQLLDYKEFIKELVKLNPVLFHISDGFVASEKDEHLDLGAGDYDLKFMKKLVDLSTHKKVVMETPKKNNNLDNDLKNMEYFRMVYKE